MNMSDKDNEKELSANPEDLGLREPGAGDDGAGVREGTVAESAARSRALRATASTT